VPNLGNCLDRIELMGWRILRATIPWLLLTAMGGTAVRGYFDPAWLHEMLPNLPLVGGGAAGTGGAWVYARWRERVLAFAPGVTKAINS
jgi:hypothetical protein